MIRRLIIFSCLLVGLGVQGCGEKSSQMTFVPIDSLGASEQSGRKAEAPKKDSIVARVNGKAILLTDFQEAVQQLEEAGPNVSSAGAAYGAGAVGGVPPPSSPRHTHQMKPEGFIREGTGRQELQQIRQQVLDGLIDQALIAQAAQSEGITVSDELLNRRIAEMRQGQSAAQFKSWLKLNNYSNETFKDALRAQLIAGELYARIADQAPTTSRQVHARHILLSTQEQAQSVLQQLQNGSSFSQLAQAYSEDTASAVNGGDLGWFPKGIGILPPEVEAISFSLEEQDISPIVKSALGYHIIKVELKAQDRPLTPQHRQILQADFFKQWLVQQRVAAQIDRYIN